MRTKKHLIAAVCAAAVLVSAVPAGMFPVLAADTVEITAAEGWFESAYVQWTPVSGASGYNVYADGKQIDSMLIRQYNGFYRADAVGLKAGSHTLQIVPLMGGKEDTAKAASKSVTVSAHDRTGFAWTKDSAYTNSTASGAYNEDGTLRSGAVVLYVTDKTKNSVSMNVVTDSKGGTTSATGVQGILSAYQKGYETRPLDLRCIGNITDPSTLEGGDLLVKGNGSCKRLSCGITIEGIGTDTVFNGFGLRIANASNVEVRNIGFMNCNSSEGDDVGLQQNNDHVWVHHCDLFYGDAGSDADQAKGDGALDTKTSTYITHSYNHFWDNGKCNLQGMKSESTDNYITYHHNWYDHSDSRHPRIRTCSVHIRIEYDPEISARCKCCILDGLCSFLIFGIGNMVGEVTVRLKELASACIRTEFFEDISYKESACTVTCINNYVKSRKRLISLSGAGDDLISEIPCIGIHK